MVNGIMSQWSTPHLDRFGDFSEEFVMLWALAVAAARPHFDHLVLVTDEVGARVFRDFPYDEIFIDLEEPFIPEPARKVWAAGKFIAFQRAVKLGAPFAHFDGDVLLRKNQRAFKAPIFTQCEERFDIVRPKGRIEQNLQNIYLYGGAARLPFIPAFARFSLTREIHTPFNMGVCGGHDLEFWDRYCAEALSILRHPLNQKFLAEMPAISSSLFVEQYLVGALADKLGKYVSTLFPLAEAGNENLMETIGYVHLLGDSKYKPEAMKAVYHKMQEHYPWLYDIVKGLNLPHKTPMKVHDYPYYTTSGHCYSS